MKTEFYLGLFSFFTAANIALATDCQMKCVQVEGTPYYGYLSVGDVCGEYGECLGDNFNSICDASTVGKLLPGQCEDVYPHVIGDCDLVCSQTVVGQNSFFFVENGSVCGAGNECWDKDPTTFHECNITKVGTHIEGACIDLSSPTDPFSKLSMSRRRLH